MSTVSYLFEIRSLYQVAVTLAVYIVLVTSRFYYIRHKRFNLLKQYGFPGPETNLFEGNMGWWLRVRFYGVLSEECKRRYGQIHSWFIGDEPSLLIYDLKVLKTIFLDSYGAFKARGHVFIDTPFFRGIFFAPYNRWKAVRKIMAPSFQSYAIRDESSKFIDTTIELLVEYIEQKREAAKRAAEVATFDIRSLMKATSLHLISAIAIKLPNVQVKENEPHVESLDEFSDQFGKGLIVWAVRFPFINRILAFVANRFVYNKALGSVRQSILRMIDESKDKLISGKRKGKQEHVIDVLVRLHHEGKLSREEVLGNAENLLVAGYDTTATTLTYTFWTLGKYSDIQEKLRNELLAHGTESKYLEQVLNEVMRIYPNLESFITRSATSTIRIGEHVIPQGTRVVYSPWVNHRNPENWPDPTKFDPSRFDGSRKIHPCAFAPFGLGERKCLGYQLAMLEMKRVICGVLLRYRVKLIGPRELRLTNHGPVITKPTETVLIQLEKVLH